MMGVIEVPGTGWTLRPTGSLLFPSRSTWRRREDVTFEPQLKAGAGDAVGSIAL
jgi:hypothetical protein